MRAEAAGALVVWLVTLAATPASAQVLVYEAADDSLEQVSQLLSQVLEQQRGTHCQVLLVDATSHNPQLPNMIRRVSGGAVGVVVVASLTTLLDLSYTDVLLDHLWGEPILPCRGVLAFLDTTNTATDTTNTATDTINTVTDTTNTATNTTNTATDTTNTATNTTNTATDTTNTATDTTNTATNTTNTATDTTNTATDTTNSSSSRLLLWFLERSGLWKHPEVWVVVVGGRAEVRAVLLHPSFRNTRQALYVALCDLTLRQTYWGPTTIFTQGLARVKMDTQADQHKGTCVPSQSVWVWERCLYCHQGDAGLKLLLQTNLSSGLQPHHPLFHDQLEDMRGHRLRLVVKSYYPFTGFLRSSDPANTTVTPTDCLDIRLLDALAAPRNFTYELRSSPDNQWGVPDKEGRWSGVVGQLQRHLADQSLMLMPTYNRSSAIQYSRLYTGDLVIIISLKPQPLPRYLSIIKPFPGVVWQAVGVSIVVWAAALWVMQRTWTWVVGGRGFTLGSALYISWAIVMENPKDNIPTGMVFRVLVGWWLVATLVINSAYRSALASTLTVQEHAIPIDTFDDLLRQHRWSWGTFSDMLNSSYHDFFANNGPIMRLIYDNTEVGGPLPPTFRHNEATTAGGGSGGTLDKRGLGSNQGQG
ncbi:uncharacterized protein [Procambarus clarkii]|uniref:uncharacterized protein isoform X2 n=1 Tax=Procambarus clarkii TaxID=6728 RepID=UPI003743DAA3